MLYLTNPRLRIDNRRMAKQEFSLPALMKRIPDEEAAYLLMEDLRWSATGVVCSHCGSLAKHYFLKPRDPQGRMTRTGAFSQRRVWKCKDCRKQFSVTTGTIFHGTKIPLQTWLFVVFEMCASKNGVAAREIERKYDVTAKSAWFMVHRIREAMKREPMAGLLSGTIVADETWIGGTPKNRHASKRQPFAPGQITDKTPVLSLIDTVTGEVRSEIVRDVTADTLAPILLARTDPKSSHLYTDSSVAYRKMGEEFASHETVNHTAGEYVRGPVTTNAAEGYFSQLKRSIDGTHHAVSTVHLGRYLAEFDYRYSTRKMNDSERMRLVMGNTGGKRLTYRPLVDPS
jgi:transposase-like protein